MSDQKMLHAIDAKGPDPYKTEQECHSGEGLLHRGFSVWVFDNQGKALLKKRPTSARLWPDRWDVPITGHPGKDSDVEASARSDANAGLGVPLSLKHFMTYGLKEQDQGRGSENEWRTIYIAKENNPLASAKPEGEGRLVSLEELNKEVEANPESFAPSIRRELLWLGTGKENVQRLIQQA